MIDKRPGASRPNHTQGDGIVNETEYLTRYYGDGFIDNGERDRAEPGHVSSPALNDELAEMAANGWILVSLVRTPQHRLDWPYLAVYSRLRSTKTAAPSRSA